MTRIDTGAHLPIEDLASAATAVAGDLLRTKQSALSEKQMTMTQVAAFCAANLGTAIADDITVSSVTISSLTAALSAATFTTTGQTSAAIAAVTTSTPWGFASKGQIEALIELAINNKAAIDELRS